MKIVKILTITTSAKAFFIPQWLQNDNDLTTTTTTATATFDNDYDCNDLPTTTTGDYATQGWTTTASTTTEELTTTLEPESMLTTTTDGEYTPPDITTTTMTSTELTSTTNTPSSDLGPIITIDVIESADEEKTGNNPDEIVGSWLSDAYSYISNFLGF